MIGFLGAFARGTASHRDARAQRFDVVLQRVMEEDNGLLLRVTSYERMLASSQAESGWSGRIACALRRGSRKIFGSRALAARSQKEE